MTRSLKELLAIGLGLGLWLAGCGKAKPPATPGVEFVSPIRGAVLTADAGTAANGLLSFVVTGEVSNAPAGSTVSLKENSLLVPDGGVSAPASGSGTFQIPITLSGGTPATPYSLELDLDSASGVELASATITIAIQLGSSGACTVAISPPDGTLFNESGIAVTGHNTVQDEDLASLSMQAKITVTAGAPCTDGETVTLTLNQTTSLNAVLKSGAAVFDDVSMPDTPVSALTNIAQALVVTASVGTGADVSSDTVHYYVDSQDPPISITSPSDSTVFTPADDIDPNTAGVQVDVQGIAPSLVAQLGLGDPATVNLTDNDAGAGNVLLLPDGGFLLPVTLSLGTNLLVASVSSVTQNLGVSTAVTVTLITAICDGGSPMVAFTVPTEDAGFNLADDQNGNQAGLQASLQLTTSSLTGSVEVCSTVAPTAAGANPCAFNADLFEIGTTTVSNGAATLGNATLGDDGAAPNQTLTAQVTDGTCGMIGQGSVTIEVHALRPIIDTIAVQNAYVDSQQRTWLNASDLVAGTAQTTVQVTADGSDQFSDGGFYVLQAGSQVGVAAPGGVATAPTASVPISLPDGPHQLVASVVDMWGNASDPNQTIPIPVTFEVYVKTSLPTCTLAGGDTNGCFNINDNMQANGQGMSSGVVSVPISVGSANAFSTDLSGAPIAGTATVTENGPGQTQMTSASIPSSATIAVAAPSTQGANTYTASVTDPAGNPAADCTPASVAVNVSTVGPGLTVVPASGGAGVDTGGFEIYQTRDGIPIAVDATDSASVQLVITGPQGGSSPKVTQPVVGGVASFSMSGAPNGLDTVTASATDVCANPGTNTATIDVQATGCDLSLVTPLPTSGDAGESVLFNSSEVTAGSATVELHSSCAAGTQVQFDSTPSGGTDQPQDGGVDANGNVSFLIGSLVDGSAGTLTSDISGGEQLPLIAYTAKLSLPAFTAAAPVAGNLEVVATADNLILSDAGVTSLAVDGGTIVANEAQCVTTACADFTLSGISGLGPVDGNGNVGTATLTLSFPGQTTTNPNPLSIASGQTAVTFSGVNLPANSFSTGTGTVTITLTDNVGNSTTESWDVTTDSIEPTAPAPTAAMADKRAASVTLSWTVPGQGGDSPVTGYELTYFISNLSATPPTFSDSSYATWTSDPTIAGVNGAVGAQLTHNLTALPTLNQYTFELRAIDSVGNRSAIAPAVTASSVSSSDANAWQTLTITDSDINADFGYVLRSGDFNGDGMQDLVITAPYKDASLATPGVVYVLNGQANLATATTTTTGLTTLTLGGTNFDWFGQDAHVADYSGDGIDDLVVGSPDYNNGQGRVDIFFGAKPGGLAATPSVTIFGDATQPGLFGYSVSSVDVNGDGTADLLVGAPGMGNGGGNVYLFVSPKTWPASAASPDAGIAPAATTVISGNPGDGLGARWGAVPIGDINSDGFGDFVVGAPGGGGTDGFDGGPGYEYGIDGKTAMNNATLSVATAGDTTFALTSRPGGYCDPVNYGYSSGGGVEVFTFWACYGANAIGDVSFTGGALPDLLVSSVYYSAVYLYDMTATGPNTTAVFSDSEGAALGWSMTSCDLNGDGHPDLLVGENDTGTPNVFLYLNTGTGLAAPPSGEIFGPALSYFGYGLASGAFQGGAKQDFAASDPVASYVNVYY